MKSQRSSKEVPNEVDSICNLSALFDSYDVVEARAKVA